MEMIVLIVVYTGALEIGESDGWILSELQSNYFSEVWPRLGLAPVFCCVTAFHGGNDIDWTRKLLSVCKAPIL